MLRNLDNLLSIPVSDPDEARRGKVLNVMLFGIFLSAILGFVVFGIDVISENEFIGGPGGELIIVSSMVFAIGSIIIFFVNRYSGRTASFLFLVLLTIASTFSDTPVQVANGRSLFTFTIPIAIASLILFPGASFIFAFLSSAIIYGLALYSFIVPNIPAIIGFFMLALVSWISSRSLEQALREVREINVNLDNLVEEKTRELTASLSRELELVGRNLAVLDSIADGVVVFDVERKSIQANPALSRLLNIPSPMLIESTVDQFTQRAPLNEEDRVLLRDLLSKPEKQINSHRIEWGDKTVSVSTAEVYDGQENALGTVAVFRDFTREAEVERMKNAFVAMVSHELRTPLNAILGYAEIFKEQIYGAVNEKQRNLSDRIITNSRRLLGLINDLLDQAQIEAGKLTIQRETVVLSELLKNVVGMMENLISEKGLALTTKLDPNLPRTLIGDSTRLQQILINLTNNAIKFTDSGSIHLQFALSGENQWKISVSDTGQGIPEYELPYIFDSFKQIEGPRTRQHGGTGLGLSIVKQLANLMGGDVSVISNLGAGSTFTVSLPLESEEGEVTPMSELALIIEDDVDLSAIFAEALESVGYEVETIKDGLEAQKRLEEITPKLILLDMHLPHVSGEDLLAEIKADKRYDDTNVVITTADARMAETYSDSADFVMVKPISFVQLRDLTARLRE